MTDMEHSKTVMAWASMVRPAQKRMSAANAIGDGEVAMPNWRVFGSYFEVCNCDAPCPWRVLKLRGSSGSKGLFKPRDDWQRTAAFGHHG